MGVDDSVAKTADAGVELCRPKLRHEEVACHWPVTCGHQANLGSSSDEVVDARAAQGVFHRKARRPTSGGECDDENADAVQPPLRVSPVKKKRGANQIHGRRRDGSVRVHHPPCG